MACIIDLNDHRRALDTSAATLALRALRVLEEHRQTLEAREKARHHLKAAERAAFRAMRKDGPTEWTLALYRRKDAARAALDALPGRGFAHFTDWLEASAEAGAALSRLPKAEARRLYSLAFPGLSRQKVEWEVGGLLSRHRMDTRRAV